jgi:hypothetical protein
VHRLPLTAAIGLAVLLSIAGTATARAETSQATATGSVATAQGAVHVAVNVNHFYASAAGTKASGTATATLTPIGQLPTTVSKPVTLAVSSSGRCTILTLTLETLELQLLGLDVLLEKVVLTVTGEPHGGVLGSLFCALAHAKAKAARAAAAARIDSQLQRRGAVRPIAFTAAIRAQAAAVPGPTCPILNLVLGPLHLTLLGLVVDLNQVHLIITAEANGGVLGSLFCGLANTKLG